MDPAKRRQIEYLLQTDPDFRAKFEARKAERASKSALFPGRTAPVMSAQGYGPDKPFPMVGSELKPVVPAGFEAPDKKDGGEGYGRSLAEGFTSGVSSGYYQPNNDDPFTTGFGQGLGILSTLIPSMRLAGMLPVLSRGVQAALTAEQAAALSPTLANLFKSSVQQGVSSAASGGVGVGAYDLINQLAHGEADPTRALQAGADAMKFVGPMAAVGGIGAGLPIARRLVGETLSQIPVSAAISNRTIKEAALSPEELPMNLYPLLLAAISRQPVARAKYASQIRSRAQEHAGRSQGTDEMPGAWWTGFDSVQDALRRKAAEDVMSDPETSASVVEDLKSQGVPEEQIKVILDQIKNPKAPTKLEDDPKFGTQPIIMRYPSGDEAVFSIKPDPEGKTVRIVRHNLRTGAHEIINYGLDPNDVPKYLKKKLGKGMSFVGFANDLTPEAATSALSETVSKFARQHSWAEPYAKDLIDYYTGQRADLPEAPAGDQAQALHRKIRKTIGKMAKEYTPGDGKSDAAIAEPTAVTRTPESPATTTDQNGRPLSALEQNKRIIERLPTEQDAAEDASMIYTKKMMDEVRNDAADFVDAGNGLSLHKMSPDKETWTVIQEGQPITGKIKLPDGTEVEQGHEMTIEDAKRIFGDKIPTDQDYTDEGPTDYSGHTKQDLLGMVRKGADDGGVEKARASLNDESINNIVEGLNDGVDPADHVTPEEVRAEIEAYLSGKKPPEEGAAPVTVEPTKPVAPATPRQLAMKQLVDAGWNPDWPFVVTDLGNKSVQDAIRNDPSLSKAEQDKILSFAPEGEAHRKLFGGVAQSAPVASATPAAKKPPTPTVKENLTVPEEAKRPAPDKPAEKPAEQKSEKIKWLDDQEAAVLKRIQDRRKNITSGIDPADMADFIELGAVKIAKGFVKASDWMKEMVRVLGDDVRPHLRKIWTEANLQYDKRYKDSTRARPGGEVGVNGEFYEGGQFLPTSESTVKGENTGKSGTPKFEDRVGESNVGIGKYSNVLVKDLFAKDPNYALWAADNLGGNQKSRSIAEYLRSRPEYAEAKAADIQKVREVLSDENKEAMKNLGLEMSEQGGKIVIGGNTYESRNIFKAAGAKFNGTEWTATADQAKAIVDRIRGLPDAPGGRGSLGEFGLHDPQLIELRRIVAERPDRSGLDKPVREIVDQKTESLLRLGEKAGMPSDVITEQVEDVAKIKTRYEDGSKMFMLASDPGSGKTYVLGAAIRELRRAGAKTITYVTLRKELIDQIKADLAEYEIGDVKFITYPEMRTSDVGDSDVLIFDEAHSIKNVAAGEGGAQQAKAAARWIGRAKFTVFSTATPFENPVQAEYLEPTGIFKPFGGFQSFALSHGAELMRVGDSQFLRWKRGPHSTANAKAFRDFFMREGVFTSRQIRLPEGMLDARMSKIEASPELVAQYNSLTAAAAAHESSLRGFGKAWVVNFQKRLLESAKVERGIEEAKDALARGRNPIIFVETKAERNIDIPDLIRREDEYEAAVREAVSMNDTPPKRSDYKLPPMGVVDVLRAFMKDTGTEIINIPSTEDVITKAFGEENIAIFTGTVSPAKAQKNLDDWRSGKKKIIVATMAKGGTGLSLHDKIGDHPTTQIVINLPWTATGVKQVAQRNARYGIKSKAEVNWIFADNIDFDRALAARVGGRMSDMGASVYGDAIKEASKLEEWSFEDATFSEINDGVHEVLGSTDKAPESAPAPPVSPDKAPEQKAPESVPDDDIAAVWVPTKSVYQDTKRYQPRDNTKGKERMRAMGLRTDGFDAIKTFFDDPAISDDAPYSGESFRKNTGLKRFVLSGNTRREMAEEWKMSKVPVSDFIPERFAKEAGMPAPKTVGEARQYAMDFAKIANDLMNPQTDGETMRVFKELRERGMSDEYLRQAIGDEKFRRLDAVSSLNPDGKFMLALGDTSMEVVGRASLYDVAQTVGLIRRDYPTLFKNNQENEVFNFVFGTPKKTSEGGTTYANTSVKDISRQKLRSEIIAKITAKDWDPDTMALNVAGMKTKHSSGSIAANKAEFERRAEEAEHSLETLKQLMTADEYNDPEGPAGRLRDEIKDMRDQLKRTDDNQGTLGFDLDVSFGLPNPEKLAQLARDVTRGVKEQLQKLGIRRQLAQQTTGQRAKDAGWFSRWILDPNTMFAAYEGQKTRKYGAYARDAQVAMNLAARNILKSAGEWQEKIGHGLKDVSKAVGRDGLKNVGDWLEGGIENAPENVREGLTKIRGALDDVRESLKSSLRDRIVYDFTQDLVGTYRKIHGIDQGESIPQGEFDAITKRAVKFAELRIPDDWGIDDYFPHMFFGDYRVFYDGQIIGTGRNRSEAITAAHKHFNESGNKGDLDKYEIRMINFQTPDVTKLGDKELARFIRNMQEVLPVGKAELKSALSGVVTPKSRRNKYAKFMFKREADSKGYEIDPVTVFEFYTGSAARYIELSRLSRIVQPSIEGLRSRGQESAADIMERNFLYMWGQKPSNASRDFDNVLNKAGFDVAPQALDRYLAYWRGLKNIGFLQFNPGFQVINALQPLQTLAPLKREGVKFSEASKFLDSKEGREAVERHGVRFFFGGKMSLEPSLIPKHLTPEQRQSLVYQAKGLFPESNNQLKSWSYMYLVGRKQGKTDAEAADYAFIEGNVGSQFLAITANQPGMVQGSVLSTVNQWKPFMVKNLSLVKRLVEAGNLSGSARWGLTILALGGLRTALRPAMLGGAGAYITSQMYDKLKEEYGEGFAKFVNFGLPALIGIDLSNSMTPLQLPSSMKDLGGVEATIVTNLLNAYRTESIHEPNKWKRMLNELPDNFPVGKEIGNLVSILEGPENGKYILSDPNGRMRFERDQVDAWKALLNRPLVDESVAYTIARAQTYIAKKMDKISDNVAASGINALREDKPFKAFEFSKGKYIFYSGNELFDWYKDHPQMPIQPVQIYRRQLKMVKEDRMTDIERAMSRGGTKAVKDYFKRLNLKSQSQNTGKQEQSK